MNEYEEYRNSKIIKCAEIEMKKCKHPYVGTEHLLLALLKLDEIKSVCSKYNLTYDNFKRSLMNIVGSSSMESNFILHTPLLKMVVLDALEETEGELDAKHLFLSILENGDGIAVRILINMNIKLDKLYSDLRKSISVFASNIDFGVNLNEYVSVDNVVTGRDKEIDLMIQTLLRKNKSNPILVGPAGVGKTAIIEELARRIKLGLVPEKLKNKTIVSLEMFSLVAGTKYRGEFEEKIKNVLDSVISAGNIILFIDEIHTIVHAGGSEGAIDAANILKPYLSRGDLSIIGATTIYEYNKYIKKDKALERRFQLINVVEPNVLETIEILNRSKVVYEKFYDLNITKTNIKDIVSLADKYIKHKKNPDKSFEVLDLMCSKLCLQNNDSLKITKLDIINIIEDMMNLSSKIDLSNFKEVFNNELIGQEKVLDKIESCLKEGSDKPISMLFCGSSGVGKTKAANLISKGLGYNLIKLDMTEYVSDASVNKLIGAPNGYQGSDEEFILDKVRFNPHSVIILDEVEKASRRVLNLFLSILDEGIISDNRGELIDFSHCIIILTSNLKQENSVGFFMKSKNNRFFSDEFIARLDEVIYFNDINDEMIEKYLESKKTKVLVSDIKENCDYKRLGFRAIERFIKVQEKNKQRV